MEDAPLRIRSTTSLYCAPAKPRRYGPAMYDWITNDNAAVATAWATFAGVAVALLAAVFALGQLRTIGKDSRDRTLAYVQLDVVPGLQGSGSWDLIIENRGASTALSVVVDGGDYSPQDEKDHIVTHLGPCLLELKTLVPGARRRVMWGYATTEPQIRAGVLEPRDPHSDLPGRSEGKVDARQEAAISRSLSSGGQLWWRGFPRAF